MIKQIVTDDYVIYWQGPGWYTYYRAGAIDTDPDEWVDELHCVGHNPNDKPIDASSDDWMDEP